MKIVINRLININNMDEQSIKNCINLSKDLNNLGIQNKHLNDVRGYMNSIIEHNRGELKESLSKCKSRAEAKEAIYTYVKNILKGYDGTNMSLQACEIVNSVTDSKQEDVNLEILDLTFRVIRYNAQLGAINTKYLEELQKL